MRRAKPKCACRKRPRRWCFWHAIVEGKAITITFVDAKPKRSPPSRRTARGTKEKTR